MVAIVPNSYWSRHNYALFASQLVKEEHSREEKNRVDRDKRKERTSTKHSTLKTIKKQKGADQTRAQQSRGKDKIYREQSIAELSTVE